MGEPGGTGASGHDGAVPSTAPRPAFYAARQGRLRDWWTLLHPPYTAWHLSYVVIGATLAPRVKLVPLLAALIAFFLAVGVAAHALDEYHGRPLRTQIPGRVLIAAAVLGLAGALALGVAGVLRVGWVLIPFLLVGPLLVVAYNAELFGGIVHTDAGFAAAWGAFPLLTSYVAQTGTLSAGSVLAAGAAFGLSAAQRSLSTPARLVRRQATSVTGSITLASGDALTIDADRMLAPLEGALRAMSWSLVLLAAALAVARLA
ncbi:MAG TPA: hypothetical protein VME44_04500 [Streptosporangiaceae bacterium]|nr:hypothetical protein [Streptosporangiaceae bacterium]